MSSACERENKVVCVWKERYALDKNVCFGKCRLTYEKCLHVSQQHYQIVGVLFPQIETKSAS